MTRNIKIVFHWYPRAQVIAGADVVRHKIKSTSYGTRVLNDKLPCKKMVIGNIDVATIIALTKRTRRVKITDKNYF